RRAGQRVAVREVGHGQPDVGRAAAAADPAVVAVVVAVAADGDEQRRAAQEVERPGHAGAVGPGGVLPDPGGADGGDLDRPLRAGRHHERLDRVAVDERVGARPRPGGEIGQAALLHLLRCGRAGLARRNSDADAAQGGNRDYRGPYTSVHTGNLAVRWVGFTGLEDCGSSRFLKVAPTGPFPYHLSACRVAEHAPWWFPSRSTRCWTISAASTSSTPGRTSAAGRPRCATPPAASCSSLPRSVAGRSRPNAGRPTRPRPRTGPARPCRLRSADRPWRRLLRGATTLRRRRPGHKPAPGRLRVAPGRASRRGRGSARRRPAPRSADGRPRGRGPD